MIVASPVTTSKGIVDMLPYIAVSTNTGAQITSSIIIAVLIVYYVVCLITLQMMPRIANGIIISLIDCKF